MTTQSVAGFEVHSEARGPHWVAWLTVGGHTAAYQGILIVGASRREAETNAEAWAKTLPRHTGAPVVS